LLRIIISGKTGNLRGKPRLNKEEIIQEIMKKLWILLLLLVCITGHTQEGDLPLELKSAFDTKYQKAKIEDWWVKNELYYLDFNFKGGSYIAVYDGQGAWLETAETISEMDIPVTVKEYISTSFPTGTICICEKVETSEKQHYLRVTLIDTGNVDRVVRADLDGKNIAVQDP
jgi:hypothetical protein